MTLPPVLMPLVRLPLAVDDRPRRLLVLLATPCACFVASSLVVPCFASSRLAAASLWHDSTDESAALQLQALFGYEMATEMMATSASYGRQPDTNGVNRHVN